MEPTEPNYLVAAFEKAKAHQARALKKLGHPATARDTSDEQPEPPAETKPDNPNYKLENRDRA